MGKIQRILDKNSAEVYPLTHERAVRDSNGINLETKLNRFEHDLYENEISWQGIRQGTTVINASGKWTTPSSNNVKSVLVPITPGEKYRVYTVSWNTIAVLTSGSYGASGSSASFASGYSSRIVLEEGESYSFFSPVDGNYLYFLATNSQGELNETHLYGEASRLDNIESNIEENDTMIEELDEEAGFLGDRIGIEYIQGLRATLEHSGYINDAGTVITASPEYYYSDPIAVSSGQTISVSGVGQYIPYFIFCSSTGEFVSSATKSTGLDSVYTYTFDSDSYIRAQGRTDYYKGSLYVLDDSESVSWVNNEPTRKILFSAGSSYSQTSNNISVTLDSVGYYDNRGEQYVWAYANGTSESHQPKTFLLGTGSSPVARVLVIDKNGVIRTRGNNAAVVKTDIILLQYNTGDHSVLGGALYGDYLSKTSGGGSLNGTIREETFDEAYQYYGWKKAEQFGRVKWTPLKQVPMASSDNYFAANVEQTGLPYSSMGEMDKRVGHDVSLHTFMTALHNPYSLIYTENIRYDHSQSAYGIQYHGAANSGPYYGVVCSGYTAYSTGETIPWATAFIPQMPELFEEIYDQSANGVKRLDIFWQSGHVRLINNVFKRNGVTTEVVISEEAQPQVVYSTRTASQFNSMLITNSAKMYRYKDLYKNISYTPSPYVRVDDEPAQTVTYNDDICTFAGDMPAFIEGDLIYIHCLNLDYPQMELYKDDTLIVTVTLSTDSRASKTQDNLAYAVNLSNEGLTYGKYKARLKNGSTYSDYTYFEIINATVTLSGDTATYSSENAVAVYWSWIQQTGAVNATLGNQTPLDGSSSGTFSVAGTRKDGFTLLKVLFQGEYGRVAAKFLEQR